MSGQSATQAVQRIQSQYFGKYRGIVMDHEDPKKLGRLKLSVPSVLGESSEDGQGVTDWAWPCLPYAGPDQGQFTVPEEGAKVWVEFEEGNLDLPIWVGTFWSEPEGESEVPEEAQEDNPRRRVLKTSSGHVLEFSDVEGKETVTVRHKDGAVIRMDEKGSVVIGNKKGTHVYLNADDGEASLVDEHGNNLGLNDQGATLTNKDGTMVDLAGETVQVVAKNVHVRSETVSLGEGAMEPAILGRAFAAVFDAHVHPTAFGPSGPPLPVPMPLSAPTHPAISKAVKVK